MGQWDQIDGVDLQVLSSPGLSGTAMYSLPLLFLDSAATPVPS